MRDALVRAVCVLVALQVSPPAAFASICVRAFARTARQSARGSAASGVFIANVADAQTNAPLPDAIVEISDLGRGGRTDWLGEVHIGPVVRGRHTITMRHIGYVPATVEIEFTKDTVGYVFLLTPSPPILDTITATAKATVALLKLRDFEMRRGMGIGRFLTDSVLLQEHTEPVASIMARHFPGLYSVGFGQGMRRWRNGVTCRPDVYIDGTRYGPATPPGGARSPIRQPDALDLRFVNGGDVAGVEYYTEASAPAQYRRPGMDCGVILIWLRQ